MSEKMGFVDKASLDSMLSNFLRTLVHLLPKGEESLYPVFKNEAFQMRSDADHCSCGAEEKGEKCADNCASQEPCFIWTNQKTDETYGVKWNKDIGRSMEFGPILWNDYYWMVCQCVESLSRHKYK